MGYKDDVAQIKKFFENIKLEEVMDKQVVTIREDADGSEAQVKFINNKINHLIVIDADKKVVGLISRKYLYKTQSPRKIMQEEMDYEPGIVIDGDSFYEKETLDNIILSNIMFRNPFTLGPQDKLAKAVKAMGERFIACIPIVDANQKVIGVITDLEVIRFIAKILSL
ncbi:MAG: CBS domain-containing protein [Candidatus Omnitrophica bacterium]|nr:CBS domain-containing protein [Candidatus Omnitrophota bacterium]